MARNSEPSDLIRMRCIDFRGCSLPDEHHRIRDWLIDAAPIPNSRWLHVHPCRRDQPSNPKCRRHPGSRFRFIGCSSSVIRRGLNVAHCIELAILYATCAAPYHAGEMPWLIGRSLPEYDVCMPINTCILHRIPEPNCQNTFHKYHGLV